MRKKKQSSVALKRAVTRAAAISSIDPALDLGEGLGMSGYRSAIAETRSLLDSYNAQLSQLDEGLLRLRESEKGLLVMTKRMLAGVMARYGSNSAEYKKAGGTRDSERRRPQSAAKKAAESSSVLAA